MKRLIVVVLALGIAGGAVAESGPDLRSPHESGWTLLASNADGMQFGKMGEGGRESFVAQVQFFPLEAFDDVEHLRNFIQQAIEADTDLTQFRVIESTVSVSTERDFPCVRTHSVTEDRKANSQILEAHGLYCRHPVRTDSAFAAIYSRRGVGRHADLAAKADRFIEGVVVPDKEGDS